MPLHFPYGAGKTTNLYYKKLIVAKANEVISGGDKYYSDLAQTLNTGKVAQFVGENSARFDFLVDSFISKKQTYLEKASGAILPNDYPQLRSRLTDELAKKEPENKSLQALSNIYKYFAEKSRPENFIG